MFSRLVKLLQRLMGEESSVWRCECDRVTFLARLSEQALPRRWTGAISSRLTVRTKRNELLLASDGHVLGVFPLPNLYVWGGKIGERNGLAEIHARFRFKLFVRIGIAAWFVGVAAWIAAMIVVFLLSLVQLVNVEFPPGGFLGLAGFGIALLGFGALIVSLLRVFGRSSKRRVISVLSQVGCEEDRRTE